MEANDLTPDRGISVDVGGNVEVTALDSSRVEEVEGKSGFDLPADARIFTSVDNKSVYLFSFYTSQSVEEIRAYFDEDLPAKGYSVKRDWTTYTIQQYSSTSVLYGKGSEAIVIGIEDQNGQRLVNVSHDF